MTHIRLFCAPLSLALLPCLLCPITHSLVPSQAFVPQLSLSCPVFRAPSESLIPRLSHPSLVPVFCLVPRLSSPLAPSLVAPGRTRSFSLRVDTSALNHNHITKQNKSAYPMFASNALMLSNAEQPPMKSPVIPLTAGPDLGRHNNARLDNIGIQKRYASNVLTG